MTTKKLQNQRLNVVLCQMTSTDVVADNVVQALSLLKHISEPANIDLISFPENCLYLRLDEDEEVQGLTLDSDVFKPFCDYAKKHSVLIHLGSIPLRKNKKLYNSTVIIWDDGSLSSDYSKIHLFDVDVEGHKPVRESKTFSHGHEPAVIEYRGWKIGLGICYDLRFPELFLHYSRHPVDLLLLPAAFLVPTGQAHWEVLLRARAIEAQAFVAAAAQWGEHKGEKKSTRKTYGHSMVIDPWGTKMVEVPSGMGIIEASLEKDLIDKVRKQIPMRNHRRLK